MFVGREVASAHFESSKKVDVSGHRRLHLVLLHVGRRQARPRQEVLQIQGALEVQEPERRERSKQRGTLRRTATWAPWASRT